jgi:hypothetical protein
LLQTPPGSDRNCCSAVDRELEIARLADVSARSVDDNTADTAACRAQTDETAPARDVRPAAIGDNHDILVAGDGDRGGEDVGSALLGPARYRF